MSDSVDYLVIGAGVSGLSFANAIREEAKKRGQEEPSVLICEADSETGGYCKTIEQDGFTWDYSGHFFHFRHPEIEAWLRERMPGQEIRTVEKNSLIRFAGEDIDFPFQKNIHQLPREDFIDCLVSLYFRDEENPDAGDSFAGMLYQRFGRGIAERFLIPYNEKLYACSLDKLDAGAMGRFFPHADIADIIRNMRDADNSSYNATFTYPLGGAIQYIRALERDLPAGCISLNEPVERIDTEQRIAHTPKRSIAYRHLVSSAPLPRLIDMCQMEAQRELFTWNKVLVFNLGFDKKGPEGVHWMYFPERELSFYRVGFYDNIMGADRMSLYVEIGAADGETLDVEAARARALEDLRRTGIVSDHQLVSHHTVTLNPAYVHITERGQSEAHRVRSALSAQGVHSIGRYGAWTYCSIEDNMVEGRELAVSLGSSA